MFADVGPTPGATIPYDYSAPSNEKSKSSSKVPFS
jgi:hypothetical protein